MFKFGGFIPESGGTISNAPVYVAALLSLVTYACLITLTLATIGCLVKQRMARAYSRRMRIFLLSYTAIMFSLSTLALAEEFIYISKNFLGGEMVGSHDSQPAVLFNLYNVPVSMPFTILGADIFMVSISSSRTVV